MDGLTFDENVFISNFRDGGVFLELEIVETALASHLPLLHCSHCKLDKLG